MAEPVLFIGHGNPMHAIEDNAWSRAFRDVGASLDRPQAILAISAHDYRLGSFVTQQDSPRTIHDFGGFPQALYDIQYPAPGSPELANRIQQLAGDSKVGLRQDWGLDHGTWTVLQYLFPKADVPVVQLSIDAQASPHDHWELGRTLQPLRDEGVLIVGSGNLVHNLPSAFAKWRAGVTATESWAEDFDAQATRAVETGDRLWLQNALDDPLGTMAHPTPDHYLPLLYAAAAGEGSDASSPIEGFDMGDISMRAFRFDA